jgi:carbon monoxide dehydrogenase subunit G
MSSSARLSYGKVARFFAIIHFMKRLKLRGSWVIKAPREDVYKIISDFENMPKYFPAIAESVRITEKEGNHQKMNARVKSFGKVFDVKMQTELLPNIGFKSTNESSFGTSGYEEFLMEDVEGGTRIAYAYEIEIHRPILRIIGTPLIKWFAMRSWKRSFIDELRKIVER